MTQQHILFNDYCTLDEMNIVNLRGLFHISINPASRIFNGHFPENPICPGVCHIELIRECVSMIMKSDIRISQLHRCRFMAVAKPYTSNHFTVSVSVSPSGKQLSLDANISDGKVTYLGFSGIMYKA